MAFNNIFFLKLIKNFILLGLFKSSEAARLYCYNGTMENPQVVPLESPLPLINSSCIDVKRVTKFFVYGYNRNSTSAESTGIVSAYLCRGDVNVVLLDWAEEAVMGNFGVTVGYFNAVGNTNIIAKKFASSLLAMEGAGLNFEMVHLVGHSLGAQICGMAGNQIMAAGKVINRITGLDPASPMYEGLIKPMTGISNNSAGFVDIIHSNSGQYGITDSVGTADFWPNYKLASGVQPGCPMGFFPLLSDDGLCSHIRAWEYYIESICNGDAFQAAREVDFPTWIQKNGTTDKVECMGEYVSYEAQGNYYLETNDKSPYGKGKAGLVPNRA